MRSVFLRLLEAEDKAIALRQTIQAPETSLGQTRFEVDSESFAGVPRSPFAYWVSDALRALFTQLPRFESEGRTAKQGLATADDFRFVRLASEVPTASVGERWFPFAKGGKYSPYYADVYLMVKWEGDGAEIKNNLNANGGVRSNVWMLRDTAKNFFFRPGLTWPLRASNFAPQVLPTGCIFSVRGYSAFVQKEDLFRTLAVFNSKIFDHIFKMSLGRFGYPEFIVGILQVLPWPSAGTSGALDLSEYACRIWALKHRLDSRTENSHAFLLPALVQAEGIGLMERALAWRNLQVESTAEIARFQSEIDERCFELYGINAEDRRSIEQGFEIDETVVDDGGMAEDEQETKGEDAEVGVTPLTTELVSWAFGAAFGRFDVRLATGERSAPPEPEPFDPLPICSPGMLTDHDGLPLVEPPPGYSIACPTDGVLTDDPGHGRDLIARVRAVFDLVFSGDADARWQEAGDLLGSDVRVWLARSFFELHIKQYSKSRRKAPMYWQLATPSASYSVWLYYHRFNRDTLFRVLNDQVALKFQHEEVKLSGLQREVGPNPSSGQRKAIDEQERFVEELRAFRQEVARVAPLWNPDLNDGVIINFALLWRLVPQHRQWQRECKDCWDKLVAGDYDWAHLAMHLWPERVVPKCASDRSLAIAHGLEDEFWVEDEKGKWHRKDLDPARIPELVRDRTSSAVKTALNDLLTAPAPTGSPGKGRAGSSGPRAKSQRTAAEEAPSARPARAPRSPAPPAPYADEATLDAVKRAIAQVAGGASKADVLAATGLSDGEWNRAVAALLERREVSRTGEKRGTRYHTLGAGGGSGAGN